MFVVGAPRPETNTTWIMNLKLCSRYLLSFLRICRPDRENPPREMSWSDMIKRLEELNSRTQTRPVKNDHSEPKAS